MKKTILFLLTAALSASVFAAPTAASAPMPKAAPVSPKLASLMIREVPLEYAAWLLSASWGRHLVVDSKAKDINVKLFLRDIDCMSALKAMCHAHGLWYREDPESGVIYIETLDDYVRGNTLNDKKFIDMVTVVYPRAEDLAESLQEVFKDMIVYTAPEEENGDDSDLIDKAFERMEQLSDRSTLVEDNSSGSGGSGATRNRNKDGMSDVHEYYDDMEEISKKTKQIVSDGKGPPKAKMPGVVFLSVSRVNNTILMRSSDREMIQQVRDVIQALDRPKAQVLLEVKVLSMDITDEKKRQVDFLINNKSGSAGLGFSEGLADVPRKPNEFGALGIAGNAIDDRSLVFQLLDEKYQLRVKMLDEQGKVQRLATPSLMVADYEASRIFVGDETTILTNVENSLNVTGNDNPVVTSVSNAETERRDIGTTLVLAPKIHADRTVTIRVMQENARVGKTKTIVYDKSAESKSFDTTDITKQTITSTVIAKSGETLALGGLMNRSEEEKTTRVPLLHKIPVIGPMLFERSFKSETVSELVVLIRPYVILTPETAERMSQQYLVGAVSDPELLGKALDHDREARIRRNMTEMLNTNLEPMETPVF